MNNKLINYKKTHRYEFYTFTEEIKEKQNGISSDPESDLDQISRKRIRIKIKRIRNTSIKSNFQFQEPEPEPHIFVLLFFLEAPAQK